MLGDKSSKPALHFATCEFQNFLTAVFLAKKIKPFISTYGIFSKFFSPINGKETFSKELAIFHVNNTGESYK